MSLVAITTEALRDRPGRHLDLLTQAGLDVRYPQSNVLTTEEQTLATVDNCVAVIAGSEPYTERVFAGLPKLRMISRNGVGYDQIDVSAATRHGVTVTITANANHQAVAEHAMALMLATSRSIVSNAVAVRGGHWRRRRAFIPLRGSTLGIVGLGRIGRSVALRAAAFGMRIVACDQYPNREFIEEHHIELVTLDELLAQSDFVTLHAPSTRDTHHLINRQTLARMKPGSVLINTARGGLVNELDLVEALRGGHLRAAALDVLQVEPPPADHPLLALDNVIISPHVASFDTQAIEDMGNAAAQNVVDLLAGRWPAESVVNPEVQATRRQ